MATYREYICETCGATFLSNKGCRTRQPRYCSATCCGKAHAKMKVCAYCGTEFYNWTRDKYCSKACASAALRGVPLSAEHRRKLSEARKASPKCHGENLYNWKGGEATRLERVRQYCHKRRTSQHIPVDSTYLRLMRRVTKNRCFYCGEDMGNFPTIEHLTPVSRGGDNQRWNLVLACKSCNSKKGAKTFEEYMEQVGFDLADKYDAVIARFYAPYMERFVWK